MFNTNLTKKQLYWLLQFSGWLVYFILSGLIYAQRFGPSTKLFINLGVNVLLNVTVTHLYRLIFIKAGWLRIPLIQLLITSFCVSWILAIPLAVINIYLDHWTFPGVVPVTLDFVTMYDYCVHIVRGLVPWMTIYIFYIYIEKLKVVEVEKYQLQAELKEDQLRYLKNQVNPHFLFNSLNSIRTLVDIEPEESKRTITNLSKFLRNTLVKSELSTIPLADELQIVQDYLSLEKVRFDERLQVQFAIGAETLDYKIPPMVVQTLVENAIKHGISKLKKGGIINIRTYLEVGQLIISIENSGTYNPSLQSEGVGMKNTEQRLRLLFGNNSSVTINNTDHETVLTCIKLPV